MKRIDEVELQQIMVTQVRGVEVLDVAAVYCCTKCVEQLKNQQIEIYIYDPKIQ
jgi:hypothetical protein